MPARPAGHGDKSGSSCSTSCAHLLERLDRFPGIGAVRTRAVMEAALGLGKDRGRGRLAVKLLVHDSGDRMQDGSTSPGAIDSHRDRRGHGHGCTIKEHAAWCRQTASTAQRKRPISETRADAAQLPPGTSQELARAHDEAARSAFVACVESHGVPDPMPSTGQREVDTAELRRVAFACLAASHPGWPTLETALDTNVDVLALHLAKVELKAATAATEHRIWLANETLAMCGDGLGSAPLPGDSLGVAASVAGLARHQIPGGSFAWGPASMVPGGACGYRHCDGFRYNATIWGCPMKPPTIGLHTAAIDALVSLTGCDHGGAGMDRQGGWSVLLPRGIGGAPPAVVVLTGVHHCQLSISEQTAFNEVSGLFGVPRVCVELVGPSIAARGGTPPPTHAREPTHRHADFLGEDCTVEAIHQKAWRICAPAHAAG